MADNYGVLDNNGILRTISAKEETTNVYSNRVTPRIGGADVASGNPLPVATQSTDPIVTSLGTDGTTPPTLPGGSTGVRGWLRYLASLLPALVSGRWPVDGSGVTQPTTINAVSTGGATPHSRIATGTDAIVVKASAATVYSYHIINRSTTAPLYIRVYDSATVALGSGTPIERLCVPAAVSTTQPSVLTSSGNAVPLGLSNGFCYTLTTGYADNDTTAVAANSGIVNFRFK